nr:hypothetical protein L203_05040 [Cryptococcus depauperatus CBS 7841]
MLSSKNTNELPKHEPSQNMKPVSSNTFVTDMTDASLAQQSTSTPSMASRPRGMFPSYSRSQKPRPLTQITLPSDISSPATSSLWVPCGSSEIQTASQKPTLPASKSQHMPMFENIRNMKNFLPAKPFGEQAISLPSPNAAFVSNENNRSDVPVIPQNYTNHVVFESQQPKEQTSPWGSGTNPSSIPYLQADTFTIPRSFNTTIENIQEGQHRCEQTKTNIRIRSNSYQTHEEGKSVGSSHRAIQSHDKYHNQHYIQEPINTNSVHESPVLPHTSQRPHIFSPNHRTAISDQTAVCNLRNAVERNQSVIQTSTVIQPVNQEQDTIEHHPQELSTSYRVAEQDKAANLPVSPSMKERSTLQTFQEAERKEILKVKHDSEQYGSEHMLLVLLQKKNGEIKDLKNELQKVQQLHDEKQSTNVKLIDENHRLNGLYKQDQQTWKTSMENAKKWRDHVKQKDLVKMQAVQELKESYETHNQFHLEFVKTLSDEMSHFKSETMSEATRDAAAHAETLTRMRLALDEIKEELSLNINVTEELESVKTLNVRLSDDLSSKSEELDKAHIRTSTLEGKLSSFEEQLIPNVSQMISTAAQLRAAILDRSQALMAALDSQKRAEQRLLNKEEEYTTLMKDYESLKNHRDILQARLAEFEAQVHAVGYQGKDLKDIIKDLEEKGEKALQEAQMNLQASEKEWNSKTENLSQLLSCTEKSLAEVRLDVAASRQRARQTELDLSAALTSCTTENKIKVEMFQKEIRVIQEESDDAKKTLQETRIREQALKDKVCGLVQSVKEAQLQLKSAQTSLEGVRKHEEALQDQITILKTQINTQISKPTSIELETHFDSLRHIMEEMKTMRSDACELERMKAEIIHKNTHIQELRKEIGNSQHTIDTMSQKIRKTQHDIDQISRENILIKESYDNYFKNGQDIATRWEKDQLTIDEKNIVQKMILQIKRGEQAFYRQELDEKCNAIKKLETRCKKLEAQMSSSCHDKLASNILNIPSPLSDPPISSTINPPSSDNSPSYHLSTKLSASLHAPDPSKISCLGPQKPLNKKKRRLMDPENMLDDEDNHHQQEPVVDNVFIEPPIAQSMCSLVQLPPKPHKKTRFANIRDSPSPPQDSQYEDVSDPIEPPSSHPIDKPSEFSKCTNEPPPASQNIKSPNKKVKNTHIRAKSAMKTRSSIDNVTAYVNKNAHSPTNVVGDKERKLRGGKRV